jgi:hypothetical protein
MEDFREVMESLKITNEDRRQYPGYTICDELIKMKKLMKWMEAKARELRQ